MLKLDLRFGIIYKKRMKICVKVLKLFNVVYKLGGVIVFIL